MTHPLIQDNLTILDQTRALATDILADDYLLVGAHFRHLIEHYALFLKHCDRGVVDYDQRDRNNQGGVNVKVFLMQLQDIKEKLSTLEINPIASVKIRCATCTSWQANGALSTIGRELIFLHSHSTHHLALIAMKLEMAGLTVSSEIGLAPSTKLHNLQNASQLNQ